MSAEQRGKMERNHGTSTRWAVAGLAALAFLTTACRDGGGSPGVDVGPLIADLPSRSGDLRTHTPDGGGPDLLAGPDTAQQGTFGWVDPRCGNQLVASCRDCPGRPYACGACEASATCVADCAAGCGGLTGCELAATCIDPAFVDCGPDPFCGCSPPTKACVGGNTTTCVDSCATKCAGQPFNAFGKCSADSNLACSDQAGPEYHCGDAIISSSNCADSCQACGQQYCVSGSCYANNRGGTSCSQGYVPGLSFYLCGTAGCCTQGFYCEKTGNCVSSCQQCDPSYQVACGDHGRCAKSCQDCAASSTASQMELCNGVCADVLSDSQHCGGCGQACQSTSLVGARCAAGHCCRWSVTDTPLDPFEPWCEVCSCCRKAGWPPCHINACGEACLPPI